jgi:hypothetical protein
VCKPDEIVTVDMAGKKFFKDASTDMEASALSDTEAGTVNACATICRLAPADRVSKCIGFAIKGST